MKRALSVLCLAIMAAAQDPSGTVSGRVLDPSGAGLPGAAVKLDTRNTTSDAEGRFLILSVTPGEYRLTVSAPGFASHTARIPVPQGASVIRNITLEVA